MSLLDIYQKSTLGITQNHGKEPTPRQPTFGFYSEINNQSPDTIINELSKLHNEYSLNDDPADLNIVAYNPEAYFGYPFETLLDPLDDYAPKNPNGVNYNTNQNYKNLGPGEGRY